MWLVHDERNKYLSKEEANNADITNNADII